MHKKEEEIYNMWIIIIVAVIAIVAWVSRGGWARFKNDAVGQKDYCYNCKYCVKNDSGVWICRLSKCDVITEDTIMPCCEKPVITEDDLADLFELGIWNEEGKKYIRETMLGQQMGWFDIDAFLKKLPIEHPEFILPDASNRYQ